MKGWKREAMPHIQQFPQVCKAASTLYDVLKLFQVIVFFPVVNDSFNRKDQLGLNLGKSVQHTLKETDRH